MNKRLINRHSTVRNLGLIMLASFVCLGAGPAAQAQGGDEQEQACTQRTLQGDYGYLVTGPDGPATLTATPNGSFWTGPVAAAVGLMTFDGAGGLSARETRTATGPVSRRIGTGTYLVGSFPAPEASCMGSATVGGDFGGLSFDFMIVPGSKGKEFSLVITNPGKTQTGVALKTGEEPCSNASLQGTYRVQSAGGISLDFGPTAAVGFRLLDGAGNLTYAEDTISRNGQIMHRVGRSATYKVLADCTVSEAFISPVAAERATFEGVVVAGGREAYFVRTGPDRTGLRPDWTGPIPSSYKRLGGSEG